MSKTVGLAITATVGPAPWGIVVNTGPFCELAKVTEPDECDLKYDRWRILFGCSRCDFTVACCVCTWLT